MDMCELQAGTHYSQDPHPLDHGTSLLSLDVMQTNRASRSYPTWTASTRTGVYGPTWLLRAKGWKTVTAALALYRWHGSCQIV